MCSLCKFQVAPSPKLEVPGPLLHIGLRHEARRQVMMSSQQYLMVQQSYWKKIIQCVIWFLVKIEPLQRKYHHNLENIYLPTYLWTNLSIIRFKKKWHFSLLYLPKITYNVEYRYCKFWRAIHSKLLEYIQFLLQSHKNNIYCQILTRKQKPCKVMQIPMRIQDCTTTHLHINGIERKWISANI